MTEKRRDSNGGKQHYHCKLTQNPQIEGIYMQPCDPSVYYKKRMQHKGMHCHQLWGHVMHAHTKHFVRYMYSTSRDAQTHTHTIDTVDLMDPLLEK